ncbi:glycosyltransferase [Caenimonas sedimenti]|uniref:Glycosyltransferase n=1 Tax=Caenimonas sedimenti TaxID=2596921 RepID=A0A562ZV89_9BURK|nr:glycosyltransferase [Caenimonas sedimenti]TWO72296.1 glycosyltransferase [Caenimonas sedimenti]
MPHAHVPPLLSICIPTYNRESQLMAQLSAIEKYASAGLEVVVSDNASTDNSWSRLSTYDGNLNLVAHRNSSNLGAGANCLKSLECATGNFRWLIGDDSSVTWKILPELISTLSAAQPDLAFFRNKTNLPWLADVSEVSSLEFLYNNGRNSSGDFHFLGNYIFSKRVVEEQLGAAGEAIQWEHPYALIAFSSIRAESSMALLDMMPFDNTVQPLASYNYRVLPRWRVARSHIGAWKTSRQAVTSDPRLLAMIDRAESRYRFRTISSAVIRDLAGVVPSGINSEWRFLLTNLKGLKFVLACGLYLLWCLRGSALLVSSVLYVFFAVDRRSREIFTYYLPDISSKGLWKAIFKSVKGRSRSPQFEVSAQY